MDKPVRKIIRLDNYDYSKNGLYFITICTVHKNELLWATDVGDGGGGEEGWGSQGGCKVYN